MHFLSGLMLHNWQMRVRIRGFLYDPSIPDYDDIHIMASPSSRSHTDAIFLLRNRIESLDILLACVLLGSVREPIPSDICLLRACRYSCVRYFHILYAVFLQQKKSLLIFHVEVRESYRY